MKLKYIPSKKRNKWDTEYFTLQGISVEDLSLICSYAMQAMATEKVMLNASLYEVLKKISEHLDTEDKTTWYIPLEV